MVYKPMKRRRGRPMKKRRAAASPKLPTLPQVPAAVSKKAAKVSRSSGASLEDLNAQIAIEGKRANARLRNLEKAKQSNRSAAYQGLLNSEFTGKTKTGKNQLKIDVKRAGSVEEARQRLGVIERFLESESSKVSKVKALPKDYSVSGARRRSGGVRVSLPSSADLSKMTKEELDIFISKFGKTANQRLRNLEKEGLSDASKAYRWINQKSFDGADFMDRTKKGQPKFKVSRSESIQEARRRAAEISKFLEAKGSTVGGVKRQYEKMAEKLRESSYFENVATEDIKAFWGSGIVQEFEKNYGYDALMEITEGKLSDMGLTALESILKEGMDRNMSIDLIEQSADIVRNTGTHYEVGDIFAAASYGDILGERTLESILEVGAQTGADAQTVERVAEEVAEAVQFNAFEPGELSDLIYRLYS